MKQVYINGIGAVIPDGSELEEIWCLLEGKQLSNEVKIPEIPPFISKRKTRRMDRFSVLALYGIYSVFKDLNKIKADEDPYEVGTIYNSDYGPLNTLLEFASSLSEESEIEPSPVMFANTVLNACIGHLCIELGLKGVSTMMLGSNYIGYAMQLIQQGKVKKIVAGGLDEYNGELFKTFNERGIGVREGASTIVLADEVSSDSFCEVIAYSGVNLNTHYCFDPQFTPNPEDIKIAINNVLAKANLDASNIDVVVTASDNHNFTDIETTTIYEIFSDTIPILHPKYTIGELLGASLGMNITVGALILKKKKMPLHEDANKQLEYVLVNDFNMNGNYTAFILKRINGGIESDV